MGWMAYLMHVSIRYPSAGNASRASSNVAMAYSCLWSMADGFRKIVSGSSNMTQMLNQLVTRQLGDGFTPTAFNTGDNGPDGPMIFNENGDRAVGYVVASSSSTS